MPGERAAHPNLRPLIDELRRNASVAIRAASEGDLAEVLEDTIGQVFMVLYTLATEIDRLYDAVAVRAARSSSGR